jgi:hypothetical protein
MMLVMGRDLGALPARRNGEGDETEMLRFVLSEARSAQSKGA